MRTALLIAAICAAIPTHAAIWEFTLGPDDSEGFGLNGANERPTPNASPAQGREIPSLTTGNFIEYNDTTKQLEITFGWGDHPDVGGTDLTADWSGVHIHGPANQEQSATVLYDLESLYSEAETGGRSGFVEGVITLVEGRNGFTIAQQEAQLLGNLWYVNVHSVGPFSGGEIRGQLLVIPEPQHYAAMAGLALLGFAGYRRYKTGTATA